MPNIKSACKRMKTSRIKQQKNSAEKSALKTLIKKTLSAVAEKKKTEADKLLISAFSAIDKAAKHNIIHKKTAARKKASLSLKVNKISR
ncbi:30S ribosomal protein S20 [bacterium]|nr:30S ribosomal protein S20 [bacterium]